MFVQPRLAVRTVRFAASTKQSSAFLSRTNTAESKYALALKGDLLEEQHAKPIADEIKPCQFSDVDVRFYLALLRRQHPPVVRPEPEQSGPG